jgi:RimJ/RimL family protein N-acetyltransferase
MLGVHPTSETELGLGYLLDVSHHGRGVMTEAVSALVDAVFTYTRYQCIRASSRIINPASRRVLDKCGFVYLDTSVCDAPARGGAVEADNMELTRQRWRQLTSARTRKPASRSVEAPYHDHP